MDRSEKEANMSGREPGWYYVQKGGIWSLAWWTREWFLCGTRDTFLDTFWGVIGERVRMPDEVADFDLKGEGI